jgi:hypothetical protein
MIALNPVFYIRGNHYLMESLYLIRNTSKLEQSLLDFEASITSEKFPKNDNIEVLSFLYLYNNKLNLHFLKGNFHEGIHLVGEIVERVEMFKNRLDNHHVMVLYYKISCLYFGSDDYKNCIYFLSQIIDNKSLNVREDLMCFSRVLSLIAHYESGIDLHLDKQIKETYKFLIKMDDLYEVQKELIKFVRKLGYIFPHQVKEELIKLYERLKHYENHPYEKRAFLYLDILSWLESHIEGRPIAEIIEEKS